MKLDTALDLYTKSPNDTIYMIDAELADQYIDETNDSKWNKMIIFICEKEDLIRSEIYSSIKNAEVDISRTPGGFICVNTDRSIKRIKNIKSYFCTVSM